MPKRKREDQEAKALGSNKAPPAPKLQPLIEKKLEALVKAIKLASRFERQKLSRRQKEAITKKENGALRRINEEIEALRTFDAQTAAKKHLRKRLLRIKSISRSEFVQNEDFFKTQEEMEAPISQAYANLNGRLFKADVVKQEDDKAIEHILRKIKKREEQRTALNEISRQEDQKQMEMTKEFGIVEDEALDNAVEEDLMEIDDEVEEEEADRIELDEEALSAFASRVVGSSESEANDSSDEGVDEDGDENGGIHRLKTIKIQIQRDGQTRDLSISLSPTPDPDIQDVVERDHQNGDDDMGEDIENGSPPPPLSPRKQSKAQNTIKPATSSKIDMFLPTLTEAGFISGSDSASDSDIEEFSKQIAPRKNRRGQRERQAIAEKKYGRNANHLRKERGQDALKGGAVKRMAKTDQVRKADRNAGWDMKRGAVGDEDEQRGSGRRWESRGEKPAWKKADDTSIGEQLKAADIKKKRDDTGTLHPSWIAKKAARSKEKQAMGKFEGTKVVFD